MVRTTDKQPSVLRSLDWWTVGIYIALLVFGWVSVCGASYTYGDTDIFSLSTRSGMQIVWIGTSLFLGLVLLLLDDRFYDTFSYVIYAILLLLLFLTIFNPHEIKGSRSWLVLGCYGFNIHHWKDFVAACGVVLLPMLFIVAQKETGSALVYLSFFLMFYREGMPGSILFTGVAMVVYFVVGIKFEGVSLLQTPTSLGVFVVILLIQTFTSVMVNVYCRNKKLMWYMLGGSFGATLLALLFSLYVIPFNIIWVQLLVTVIIVGYLLVEWLRTRLSNYFFILAFAIGSIAFFYSADYVLNNVLEPHQRVRINVLLGLDDDLSGAGYNVHQSEIAIGSGGLRGKGFLNGTQTKLKFVPEQDTDFIFCTVGEEEGFFGSAGVLILFLLLILRLIHLAERQPFAFGRIYGYCVLSIFLFHVFINVGMVLGLTPVIGIPLPFFSYGGSSLWGFTFLLFIFLRIDAGRNLVRIE